MKKLLTSVAFLLCSLLTSFAQFSGSGSGTQSDPYRIYNEDEFYELRNCLNQEGVYFKLMNSLDLSDWLSENYPTQGWQPVGSTSEPFKGILDGNGKTISGFSITRTSTDCVGLFGVVDRATIKNLTLKGNIKGKGYVGSLFGSGSATVTNYSFEGTVTGTGSYVGGVGGNQGYASSSITVSATVQGGSYTGGIYGNGAGLSSATFTGEVTGSGSNVGGLEGRIQVSHSFRSCTVNGPVKSSSSSAQFVGGLVGYTSDDNVFQNCTQLGKVTGGEYTGGLVGMAYNYVTINTCSQEGAVTGTGNYVGGLVGYIGNSTASNCNHKGNVSGQQYTGGSVGYAAASITLNNSTQRGNVSGTSQTGGIIGHAQNGAINLTSCYAEGDITGTTSVGGICGQIQNPSSSSISACSFWGNISGTSQLGGVVGYINTLGETVTSWVNTTRAGYKKYSNIIMPNHSYQRTDCFYNTANPSLGSSANGGYVSIADIAQDINEWVIESHEVYTNGGNNLTNAPCIVYDKIKSGETSKTVDVLNCSAVGNITGTGQNIGGIVGKDCSEFSFTLISSKTVYFYYGFGINTETESRILKKYTTTYTNSNISESYFSGNLIGSDYIGGIAGDKNGGCINNCYASGSISGGQYVGGIAGSLTKDSRNINENSMNSNVSICSSIIGTSDVGKIYGATDGNFSVAALGTNSENRSVASMQLVINGITQEVNDNLQNGTAVGISQLRRRASYVAWGWNVNSYWNIIDTESFPYKTWQAAPPTINTSSLVSGSTSITGNSVDGGTVYIKIGNGSMQSVICSGTTFTLSGIAPLQAGTVVQLYTKTTDKEASYINQYTVDYPGSGTEADPWRVYSAEDLQGVYKAGYYKQMNDINLSSWISANSATAGWIPVGYNGTDPVIYDGDNHKVTGLWTNRTTDYTGLFSSFTQGTIRNLTVEVATGKQVKGGNYTGIVIGRIGGGTIENVTAKGNVSAGNYAGGIAGYTTSTILKQLSYTGQLTATGYVGGITSYCNTSTTVTDCEAKDITINATVNASNLTIGGLVGNHNNSSFNNCKVSGAITVTSTSSYTGVKVGGLVATSSNTITECATNVTISNGCPGGISAGLVAQNSGTIRRCSAAGTVTSTGASANTGGLVANAMTGSVIEDCYSTADVTGVQYTAGLVAYNYGNVNRCYASGDVSSTYHGAGLVGYNDGGASAVVTNCVALGSRVEVSDQSGWSYRVIGGFTEGTPEPDESNYAWNGMQKSVNGRPKDVVDTPLDGQSLSDTQIKQKSTYTTLSWDFDNVWAMPADSYPVLQWQNEFDGMKGDLNGDGDINIIDIMFIIDVMSGDVTDEYMVWAADVTGDDDVNIFDIMATIDLMAEQPSAAPASYRPQKRAISMQNCADYISATANGNNIEISLDNANTYSAFQMTVTLPEGCSISDIVIDNDRCSKHMVTWRQIAAEQYLVAVFSLNNKQINGTTGRLISINVNNLDGEATMSDAIFATTEAQPYLLNSVSIFSSATGIESIQDSRSKIQNDASVYDLSGRKWSTGNGQATLDGRRESQRTMLPKGVYIVNGKKVTIK